MSMAIILSIMSYSCAQTVEGDWSGTLNNQGTKLPINFHISKTGDHYNTTMDAPTQGVTGFQTTSTSFIDNEVIITVENMQMVYKGVLKDGVISGTYTQRGSSFPLEFRPLSDADINKKTRPQDPKTPFPYTSEDVSFTNTKANNIKLVGTLTLPENVKNPPVAILISGDGGQNRDTELFNHRPFLVLSDYLTKNGIAVLRFDDRGVEESEGTQRGITPTDIATDVETAFSYLKNRTDVNIEKIGLIGHSDGGFVAQIVASKNKNIDFTILLGSPGIEFEGSKENPKQYLSKMKCSVLALNGDKDMIRNSKIHLPAIETALKKSGNNDVTTMELENINHFFQPTTERGGIRAVSTIEETYSPKVLEIIGNWINLKTK